MWQGSTLCGKWTINAHSFEKQTWVFSCVHPLCNPHHPHTTCFAQKPNDRLLCTHSPHKEVDNSYVIRRNFPVRVELVSSIFCTKCRFVLAALKCYAWNLPIDREWKRIMQHVTPTREKKGHELYHNRCKFTNFYWQTFTSGEATRVMKVWTWSPHVNAGMVARHSYTRLIRVVSMSLWSKDKFGRAMSSKSSLNL